MNSRIFRHIFRQSLLWIFLCLSITYLPFMSGRVTRTAGDEKVYVSQAVEMARHGSWFLQTYADKPNYYKGPFHYIALRAGIAMFGQNMLATVYMNYVILLIAACLLARLLLRLIPNRPGFAVWASIGFATCADLYAHAFASQMEVELAGFFAIGAYFLGNTARTLAAPKRNEFYFWLIAGLAGWMKSPLHSVLLGSSALLFWFFEGTLWKRMWSAKSWASLLCGIILCAAGYAPAYLLDRDAFMNAYYYRETMFKPANGGPWYQALVPIFSYSVAPWTLVLLLGLWDSIGLWFKRSSAGSIKNGVRLGVSILLPTLSFFVYHPYRGDNYGLPALSGYFILGALGLAEATSKRLKIYQLGFGAGGIALLIAGTGLGVLFRRFEPFPDWLPRQSPIFLAAGGVLLLIAAIRIAGEEKSPFSLLAGAWCTALVGVGSVILALGEHEMVDLKVKLAELETREEKIQISYSNMSQSIWSEWGYLNFMIGRTVRGIHTPEQMKKAIQEHHLILAREDWALDQIVQTAASLGIKKDRLEITPWTRWLRHGKDRQGRPVWAQVWDEKSLKPLEGSYFMVRFRPG